VRVTVNPPLLGVDGTIAVGKPLSADAALFSDFFCIADGGNMLVPGATNPASAP
jgi:hypothetical protein